MRRDMVADARTRAAFSATDPHVRQIDPWRDGRAVANLLEASFRDEFIDESGLRLIHSLRNYGMLDALAFGFGAGFVWVEDGEVIGNASVQRNFTRKDTWIIGNVATHTAHRNRGVGRAVVEACVRYAAARGARHIALQVDVTNKPALHLYEKLGFERLGEITHYVRSPVRVVRVQSGSPEKHPEWSGKLETTHSDRSLDPDPEAGIRPRDHGLSLLAAKSKDVLTTASDEIRKAHWSDRAAVWSLAQHNLPERFTFAESFEQRVYQLGLRWSLLNALSGNLEQWLIGVATPGVRDGAHPIGAVRTRVNFEGSNHHLELLLDGRATADDGVSLVEHALKRFDNYISKPIYAAQARPHEASHDALQMTGFQPARTLIHMKLRIEN